jgi:hypothetical protein
MPAGQIEGALSAQHPVPYHCGHARIVLLAEPEKRFGAHALVASSCRCDNTKIAWLTSCNRDAGRDANRDRSTDE